MDDVFDIFCGWICNGNWEFWFVFIVLVLLWVDWFGSVFWIFVGVYFGGYI